MAILCPILIPIARDKSGEREIPSGPNNLKIFVTWNLSNNYAVLPIRALGKARRQIRPLAPFPSSILLFQMILKYILFKTIPPNGFQFPHKKSFLEYST
jgi:hypothetical protein